MSVESLAYLLSSLQAYSTDPYDPFRSLNYQSFQESDWAQKTGSQTAASIALFPLKVTAGLNLARMGWYGSRSTGLLTDITRPFMRKRQVWSYEARHLKGYLGNLIENKGILGKAAFKRQFASGKRTISSHFSFPMGGSRPDAVVSGKQMVLPGVSVEDLMDMGEIDPKYRFRGYKPLLAERMLLRPERFGTLLEQISPGITAEAGGLEHLTHKYLERMYRLDEEAHGIRGFKQRVKNMGSRFSERTRSASSVYRMDRLENPFRAAVGIKPHSRLRSATRALRSTRSEETLRFLKEQRARYTTAWDIVTGKGSAEKGFFRKRAELVKGLFTGEKRFAPWLTTNRNYARMVVGGTDSTMEILAEHAQRAGQTLNPLARTSVMDYHMRMLEKVRKVRAFRAVGATTMGVGLAVELAKSIYKKAPEIMARASSTIYGATRPEFGTGDLLTSSRMMTERQRAVEAIANAQMNARYLLGNEAMLYH